MRFHILGGICNHYQLGQCRDDTGCSTGCRKGRKHLCVYCGDPHPMHECRRWHQICRRRALYVRRFGIPDQARGAIHHPPRLTGPAAQGAPRGAKAKLRPARGQAASYRHVSSPPPVGAPASPTVTISPTSPVGPASGNHATEPDAPTPATELDSGSSSRPDVLEGEARVNTHALALSGDDAEASPSTEPEAWDAFSESGAAPGAPASP